MSGPLTYRHEGVSPKVIERSINYLSQMVLPEGVERMVRRKGCVWDVVSRESMIPFKFRREKNLSSGSGVKTNSSGMVGEDEEFKNILALYKYKLEHVETSTQVDQQGLALVLVPPQVDDNAERILYGSQYSSISLRKYELSTEVTLKTQAPSSSSLPPRSFSHHPATWTPFFSSEWLIFCAGLFHGTQFQPLRTICQENQIGTKPKPG
ncbi:hypothetical protein M413DRAFT_424219 [Hebeloma cylindrosporum]|uniref:Uncharacterized protein n=1 Tax=Hebeloma cylindrosporum TaxID=76867 RepID=A0A0C2XFV8_HEBCY|nr:hypothetical protein M413DRAFT_424219 [Hebeloma cylindrosporum h7]